MSNFYLETKDYYRRIRTTNNKRVVYTLYGGEFTNKTNFSYMCCFIAINRGVAEPPLATILAALFPKQRVTLTKLRIELAKEKLTHA